MLEIQFLQNFSENFSGISVESTEFCVYSYVDVAQKKMILIASHPHNAQSVDMKFYRSALQEWIVRRLVEESCIQLNHKGLFNLATTLVPVNIKLNVEKRNATMKELAEALDQSAIWIESADNENFIQAGFAHDQVREFDMERLPVSIRSMVTA